jgi:HEAT repeat protein
MAEVALESLLEEIGKDNPVAISALVKLIRTSQQEVTHWKVADILGEIATNNSEAISALVNLIGSSQNETTQLKAATSLGKIEKDNSVAIETLVNLMRNSQDGFTRRKALFSLREIGTDNPVAIETLVELIGTSQNPVFLWTAADILGKIDKYNQIASEILVKLIREAEGKNILINATVILNKIGKHSANGIVEALVEIMENTQNDLKLGLVVGCLARIAKDKQVAIEAFLVNRINKCDDENILLTAAGRLGGIHKNNPVAIGTLVKLISTSQDKDILWGATGWLGDISNNNPVSISALVELIRNSRDEHIRWQAAESLEKIDKDNPVVIMTLVELIRNSGDKNTRREAAYSLSRIMKGKHLATVVSGLKDCLTSEISENDSNLYKNCFEIIWNCAQNLPYPTFYQAWHHQLTTPHPEVPETTGVGSTPFTQSLNLADLPKILDARLVETQLIDSLQLICIDTSKFIDSHNPALEIYEQFLDRNCPQRPNGEPETLSQLKSYWNRLRRHSDKHSILIFYQDPTSPADRGLSPNFLDALTRFDGNICLITDSPHPPLQTFSPHDPDLLQSVVNWLKRVHFES